MPCDNETRVLGSAHLCAMVQQDPGERAVLIQTLLGASWTVFDIIDDCDIDDGMDLPERLNITCPTLGQVIHMQTQIGWKGQDSKKGSKGEASCSSRMYLEEYSPRNGGGGAFKPEECNVSIKSHNNIGGVTATTSRFSMMFLVLSCYDNVVVGVFWCTYPARAHWLACSPVLWL